MHDIKYFNTFCFSTLHLWVYECDDETTLEKKVFLFSHIMWHDFFILGRSLLVYFKNWWKETRAKLNDSDISGSRELSGVNNKSLRKNLTWQVSETEIAWGKSIHGHDIKYSRTFIEMNRFLYNFPEGFVI